jgi:hypothetical protein
MDYVRDLLLQETFVGLLLLSFAAHEFQFIINCSSKRLAISFAAEKKRFCIMRKTWRNPAMILVIAIASQLWFSSIAHASSIAAPSIALSCPTNEPTEPAVACGTDYFQTSPGTFFTFNGTSVGPQGVPFGPGVTDTVVQRTSDILLNVPPTAPNLLITGLQLESTAPVSIPGVGTIPIFVSLDPANLANDTGTMAINGTTAGGTLTSNLHVFFGVCTAPGVMGVGCGTGTSLTTDEVTLSSSGKTWVPSDPTALAVSGLDCDSLACMPAQIAADQAANVHSVLLASEVDFFPDL